MTQAEKTNPPFDGLDEARALQSLYEGTVGETGARFFQVLVETLAKALGTHGAMVTEYLEETRQLRTLAFILDGKPVDTYTFDIRGTPCESVIERRELIHLPDKLLELYPQDEDAQLGAVSYLGMPLTDLDGRILGHLAVIDRRPMPEEPVGQALFEIFGARAAAELRRLRAEADVREREEKLSRLVAGAMDAIIELDESFHITQLNQAGERVFAGSAAQASRKSFLELLDPGGRTRFEEIARHLEALPEEEQRTWIPDGLVARSFAGDAFQAEATLSRSRSRHATYYTLILRNVNERIEAEQQIRALSAETQYLREELASLQKFDGILGESPAIRRVLHDVEQVAATDASVLILGETGTGKELIARAIHTSSGRSEKPLVKVNCAAVPAGLIESEFFGHERGAFTGATQKRQGRFALADGGTIFLDEVGELPLELQGKLLRVLQEGEFEPVGSSQTVRVDVRVIAATNRDLGAEAKAGTFREDLYYRLNVFPIEIPALRERAADIPLLATHFAQRYASGLGRTIAPLSKAQSERLRAYTWPGNVRELQNVIERAVITAREGCLNLERALGGVLDAPSPEASEAPQENGIAARIRTVDELQELERENIVRALESTNWKVSGEQGAAELLKMKPSTLSSRMKALGIRRAKG